MVCFKGYNYGKYIYSVGASFSCFGGMVMMVSSWTWCGCTLKNNHFHINIYAWATTLFTVKCNVTVNKLVKFEIDIFNGWKIIYKQFEYVNGQTVWLKLDTLIFAWPLLSKTPFHASNISLNIIISTLVSHELDQGF